MTVTLTYARPQAMVNSHVTGHLFVLDPVTGGHVTFHRRHVEAADGVHRLRLDFR